MLPVQTICFVRAFFIAPLFSIYPLKRYKRYLIFSVYIFRLLRKGGEIMGTSSFEKAVCLQFNALMMILLKVHYQATEDKLQDVLGMKFCFVNCLK